MLTDFIMTNLKMKKNRDGMRLVIYIADWKNGFKAERFIIWLAQLLI